MKPSDNPKSPPKAPHFARLVQKRVDTAVRRFNLPRTFSVDDLAVVIARTVGKSIEFLPCQMTDSSTGLVVDGQHITILYDSRVSPIHQAQVKLHELGHVALGHTETDPDLGRSNVLGSFLTSLSSYKNAPTLTLRRRNYEALEEIEAEYFATVLLDRVQLEPLTFQDPIVSISLYK